MRGVIPKFFLAVALSITAGVAAVAAGGRIDINKSYQTHSNCHIAYDKLVEEVSAGQRPSDEELLWAQDYEAKSIEPDAFCPTPPESLLVRATDHVVSTQNGLERVMVYAEKQDDPTATFEAGLAFALDKFGEGERPGGYQLVQLAAEWNEPTAAFTHAVWLSTGKVTGQRENAQALPFLEIAGEAGHLDAMFNAGLFYMNGLGTKKDPKKSFYWFRKAAENGHPYAAIMAYDQITQGNGTKKDFDLAYRLARNVAQEGDPYGMVLAAASLLQGKKPFDHQDEILYWLDQAEMYGDAEIQTQVSDIRGDVVNLFNRHSAPPQYTPRERKACPMKTVCLVDRFSGVQSCTTNKDYWSDCDY